MKPHKHAEVIKAWADGAEIEWRTNAARAWWPIGVVPRFHEEWQYRIKPEPTSSMTGGEAYRVFSNFYDAHKAGTEYSGAFKAVADEAVRRYVREQQGANK